MSTSKRRCPSEQVAVAHADTTLVFVYGTLRRGGCRNRVLADQELIGEAETTDDYALFDLGSYPGLIHLPADGDAIPGDIYRVDADCLRTLDAIEAVDEGLYHRDIVALQSPYDSDPVEVWLYAMPLPPDAARIDRWQ